jgi:hypothetical protein
MSGRMNCYQSQSAAEGIKVRAEQPLGQRVDNVNTPLAGHTRDVHTLPSLREAAKD